MQTFAVGTEVAMNFAFVDLNGDPIVPLAISVKIYDEEDVEKGTFEVPLAMTTSEAIDLVVPGMFNLLEPEVNVGLRTVEVTFNTAQGDISQRAAYTIRRSNRLIVLTNSFQTWSKAQLEVQNIPNLLGWLGATDVDRQVALIEAFTRLTRLGYFVRWPRDIDDLAYLRPGEDRKIAPRHWAAMTLDQWNTWYPETFRQALRRAQIVEADNVLGSDVVGKKRRSGLLSESIGESSMMFRSGKPLDTGISPETMRQLTGFLDFRATTTRS